jgi:hypothetical protein
VSREVKNINFRVMERFGATFNTKVVFLLALDAISVKYGHRTTHLIVRPVSNSDTLITHENASAILLSKCVLLSLIASVALSL